VALFQEYVDTRVNGRSSLFRIDSVHQMETSLSHAFWPINTLSLWVYHRLTMNSEDEAWGKAKSIIESSNLIKKK
jgi:hypothetical protein